MRTPQVILIHFKVLAELLQSPSHSFIQQYLFSAHRVSGIVLGAGHIDTNKIGLVPALTDFSI